MQKPNWMEKMLIVLAFFVGLIVNMIARKILPEILPASMAKGSDFISVAIMILVSGLIVFVPIYIKYYRRRKR